MLILTRRPGETLIIELPNRVTVSGRVTKPGVKAHKAALKSQRLFGGWDAGRLLVGGVKSPATHSPEPPYAVLSLYVGQFAGFFNDWQTARKRQKKWPHSMGLVYGQNNSSEIPCIYYK